MKYNSALGLLSVLLLILQQQLWFIKQYTTLVLQLIWVYR